jgi:phage terminase large subunit-like protein
MSAFISRAAIEQMMPSNEFASSSSQFVELSTWDKCVDLTLGHMPPDPRLPVFCGVDASYKHDQTAIVCVTFDKSRQQARLVTHRVYQPDPDHPLDFELTVEATLREFAKKYWLRGVWYDPWQMQSVAQRLRQSGLPMQEFPQTVPNLTQATQCLFDLIQSQSLVLYPDPQIRLAISRCVAIEGPRGWRIGKDKQSFKVDVIVALAMAAHAAVASQSESSYDTSLDWVGGPKPGEQPSIYSHPDIRGSFGGLQQWWIR